jgi:hypothetical protein
MKKINLYLRTQTSLLRDLLVDLTTLCQQPALCSIECENDLLMNNWEGFGSSHGLF